MKHRAQPTGPVRISEAEWSESYRARAAKVSLKRIADHAVRFGHDYLRRDSNGGCLLCHKESETASRRRRGMLPRMYHLEKYDHIKVSRPGRDDCAICHRIKARKPPRPSHESRYGHLYLARRTKHGCATCHAMREAGVKPKDKAAREYANLILNDPCAYCGGEGAEFDHIHPVSKGGITEADNLTRCCGHCNRTKHKRDLLLFLATRKAA